MSLSHSKRFLGLITASSTIAFALGCAATRQAHVDPAPTQLKSAHSILDLPIYQIDIRGYRMQETLRIIDRAIETKSKGKLHFTYSTSWIHQREYARRYRKFEDWPTPDPFVSIEAANTTLGRVLDSLCQQAGWSYEFTPVGLRFLVDAHPTPGPQQ